jgi:hypothetical protein
MRNRGQSMSKSSKRSEKRVTPREHWKDEPDDHYPAAYDYLTLILDERAASAAVEDLRTAPLVRRKAKDLLRASGLPVLEGTNVHVAQDLAKVHSGTLLSPVLLVRGQASAGIPLIVADGYHRICASYHLDEDADIPCRIAAQSEALGA